MSLLFVLPLRRACAFPLCPQRGEIEFEVVYVAPEVDSDDENVEYEDESGHRYRLYLDELEDGNTATHCNSTHTNPSSPRGKAQSNKLSGVCLRPGHVERCIITIIDKYPNMLIN